MFHCVHFECPAEPGAVEEYRRTHKEPIPPPVSTVPHIPVHDPQEDYLASNSDPEDDAQHNNMLRNAGHYNAGLVARAEAAPVHQGVNLPNNPAPQAMAGLQQGVDRGDGFGFEPPANGGAGVANAGHAPPGGRGENSGQEEESANNSIHSD